METGPQWGLQVGFLNLQARGIPLEYVQEGELRADCSGAVLGPLHHLI